MTGDLVVVLDEWLRPREVTARLRQERLRVWHEAKALAESSAESSALGERALTYEEQGRWDLIMAELERLDSLLRIRVA